MSNVSAPYPAVADGKKFALPNLPWAENALEPIISAKTISFHYGKHHAIYVDNLNKLITGTQFEGKSLVEIIRISVNNPDMSGIFNNAAQLWNHSFYWESLAIKDSEKPSPALLSMINDKWGTFEEFRKAFLQEALGQFGSGWVWLVLDTKTKQLDVLKTANAHTPISNDEFIPLAVLDVWEHAYYLDYQNKRAAYAEAVLDKLFNWQFITANLNKIT